MIKIHYMYDEDRIFSIDIVSTACLSETTILNRVADTIKTHRVNFKENLSYRIYWNGERMLSHYLDKIDLLLKEQGVSK